MMHVKQIVELIEDGKSQEAEDAIEQLLALGPSNIEAMKLRAAICSRQGRFSEELEVWTKVLKIDSEDPDALHWFELQNLEEQEHHFYSDHITGGGARYITYQKGLLRPMIFGLIGSLGFTFFTNLALTHAPALIKNEVLIAGFFLVVFVPLVLVIHAFLTSMYLVTINKDGILIQTRLARYNYSWDELDNILLSHEMSLAGPKLNLFFIPKQAHKLILSIDLNPDETSIRSRRHFIQDITELYKKPKSILRQNIKSIQNRKIKYF